MTLTSRSLRGVGMIQCKILDQYLPRGKVSTSSVECVRKYRKMGNFRVVQFSRNFAVCFNLQKLKSAKYFPIFEKLVLRN